MLLKTKFSESNGVLSTDGRWLAYESDESGQTQVPRCISRRCPTSRSASPLALFSPSSCNTSTKRLKRVLPT